MSDSEQDPYDLTAIEDTISRINSTAENIRFVKEGNQVIKITTDPTTGEETREVISDYTEQQEGLDSVLAQAEDIGSFDDWLTDTGNDDKFDEMQTGFEDLTELVANNNQDQTENAEDYVARTLGYGSATEHQDTLGGLQQELNSGVGAQEGLNDEEQRAYGRVAQNQQDTLRYNQTRDLDSIVGSGSTARALMAADELRREFSSVQAAADAQLLLQDQSRRQYNFEQKATQYWNMVQSGQMTYESFMDGVRADRMNALQAYSQGMTQMMGQHSADLEALRTQADIIYKNIQTQMGLDEMLMEQTVALFEMELAGDIAALEASLALVDIQITLDEVKEEDKFNWGAALTAGTAAATAGAATGGTIGGVGGSAVPVVGNLTGAALGGIIGGVIGFIGGFIGGGLS